MASRASNQCTLLQAHEHSAVNVRRESPEAFRPVPTDKEPVAAGEMTDRDEQEKREGAEVLLSLKRGRDEQKWGSDSNKSEQDWLSAQAWVGGNP